MSHDSVLRERLRQAAQVEADQDLAARVDAVQQAYLHLPRADIGAEHVLELKFACLHWRHRLVSQLSGRNAQSENADDNTLSDIVDALNPSLPAAALTRLTAGLDPGQRDRLFARQGVVRDASMAHRALAGPGISLDIRANRRSAWPFERWKRKPAFSVYEFEGDGVNFRGLHLRPGDILLANVNIDGNGVYTTLSDPARFSSHAAVFAILEHAGRRWPAVIETYEKGARAVPLNVFLGPAFCAYVEVYRHRALDEGHTAAINRAVPALLEQVRGYNFDSTSSDREYVSCCTVGRLLHRAVGLEPATSKSCIRDPVIRANLARLGYRYFDFFAPVDYVLDANFHCAGWVDNHQFLDLLARELVENHFRELFAQRQLQPGRLPLMGRLNHWGIGQIRRQSLTGRVIGRIEGFDQHSLPRGPDPLLAVITLVEAQLGRAIRRTRRWLGTLDHPSQPFSLAEFQRQARVRDHLANTVRLAWLN